MRRVLGFGVVLSVVLVDQLSKWIVMMYLLADVRRIVITPFLNFTLAFNKGVSFSFLASSHSWMPWLLIILSIFLSGIVFCWLLRAQTAVSRLAFGLVLGGAIGNLIDRVRLKAVIDFIDFHLEIGKASYHFAIFNVADAAITIGVVLILWEYLWHHSSSAARTAC